jgi:hypothetical protein
VVDVEEEKQYIKRVLEVVYSSSHSQELLDLHPSRFSTSYNLLPPLRSLARVSE